MSTPRRRALYGRMAGDTTLTSLLAAPPAGYGQSIYYQAAPEGALFPFVIFNHQSGVPTEAMTDPQALDTDVWLVKAIAHDAPGVSTADAVEAISARIRTLLNDAVLSISGEVCLYLRRQSDVDYQEVTSGETYLHSGSLFRLVVDP